MGKRKARSSISSVHDVDLAKPIRQALVDLDDVNGLLCGEENGPSMPTYDSLMQPTLDALVNLGGSGTIAEIAEKVIENLRLPESTTSQLINPERSSQTVVENRLAWARSWLKKYGLLENSARGVWALTDQFDPDKPIDPKEIVRTVNRLIKAEAPTSEETVEAEERDAILSSPEPDDRWRETLRERLLRLDPGAFERLTMRLLREAGFVSVEVTGRVGDGGIDGRGLLKLQGVLTYRMVFQCKRYQGPVSASAIRDFRGAMIGRADRGLFITTSRFTDDARREATRDGADPIDLVTGDELIDMMRELRLGVRVTTVERVDIDEKWFDGL